MLEKHVAEAGAEVEPVRDALRRSLKDVAALPQPHYERLLDVVDWLIRHPESDVFPRQLPVRGWIRNGWNRTGRSSAHWSPP